MPVNSCSLSSLRFALNHLYEPKLLQASPLIEMLGVTGKPNAVAVLRETLMRAIESLKPAPSIAAESPIWRDYEILHYRYVQQSSQQQVADQLGLSIRHLKRAQRRALEALAGRLRERCGLFIDLGQEPTSSEADEEEATETPTQEDLRWLTEQAPDSAAHLSKILPAVLALAAPLATRHGTTLQASDSADWPAVEANPVALRQALLSLLSVAVRRTAGGGLAVSATPVRAGLAIRVEGEGAAPAHPPSTEDEANLSMAHQLAAACRGRLELGGRPPAFAASLVLPVAARTLVLVIDDNADAIRLLERYAQNTRYRVLGVQSAEQALQAACDLRPQAIVLDVMMPDVDGWELLGRLKQHPLTGEIPVVACTILAQDELALALGVSAFLRKPVTDEAFLAALDRLLLSPDL